MTDGGRLNEKRISHFLKNKNIRPKVYDVLDSTNAELKRRIRSGDKEYNLIVADRQTMGRGRLGRSFESPKGTGIYMSLLLVPGDTEDVLLITSAAAVAVCLAIRRLTDRKPLIKWVNDIYINGKKVCGILAEGVTDSDGKLNIILGIGINVIKGPDTFSPELDGVAGAIYEADDAPRSAHIVDRDELAAAVADEFMDIYADIGSRSFLVDYKRWSMVTGKNVRYLDGGVWHEAIAVDIDNDGALIVQSDEGMRTLSTGEITLRIV